MKRFFSLIIIFATLFVPFYHTSMMAFWSEPKTNHKSISSIEVSCCSKTKKDCSIYCCFSPISKDFFINSSNPINDKKLEKKEIYSPIFSLENQNKFYLVKINSPPNIAREIKNYFYGNLIWIIRSNC